jgi:hypothetical protein
MLRDLSTEEADDQKTHYGVLLSYARQYLDACRNCRLLKCAPEEKGCGYSERASGNIVKASLGRDPKYKVSPRTDFQSGILKLERKGVTATPDPRFATDWRIEGQPHQGVPDNATSLKRQIYGALCRSLCIDENFVAENLSRSFSGTCFAGRITGNEQSRNICQDLRFRSAGEEYSLDRLLTIHGWSDLEISRVSFFNSRTGQLDRDSIRPSLVVADGDGAFLDVLGKKTFSNSDIIGVISRVIERDRLESLGMKMEDLGQWYSLDEEMLINLPSLPAGISMTILKKR